MANLKRRYNPDIENYYRLCRIYLTYGEFNTQEEKLLWTLHTDGLSYREILRHCTENKLIKYSSLQTIHKIVTRVKRRMFETDVENLGEDDSDQTSSAE